MSENKKLELDILKLNGKINRTDEDISAIKDVLKSLANRLGGHLFTNEMSLSSFAGVYGGSIEDCKDRIDELARLLGYRMFHGVWKTKEEIKELKKEED